MKKLPILIYSIAFLLFSFQLKAQKAIENTWTDTTNASIHYDSSKIVIGNSILDKNFWLEVFSRDTSVLTFLKRNQKINIAVAISKIDPDVPQPLTYTIKVSPIINIEKDIAQQLTGWGYSYYTIKLIPLLHGKYSIEEIKFIGLEI